MKALQYIYTSWENGGSQTKGYMIYSKSEGISDDECEDCDGYDYSDCDMNRCKDDCEHCGGRQYVCNDSCFYHRYKTCLKIISDNSLIEEELKEGMDLLHKISAPNSKHDIILQEKGKT